ncbi:MAG: hypothetical protein ACE5EK_05935 [Nitrospinales bacterium]
MTALRLDSISAEVEPIRISNPCWEVVEPQVRSIIFDNIELPGRTSFDPILVGPCPHSPIPIFSRKRQGNPSGRFHAEHRAPSLDTGQHKGMSMDKGTDMELNKDCQTDTGKTVLDPKEKMGRAQQTVQGQGQVL